MKTTLQVIKEWFAPEVAPEIVITKAELQQRYGVKPTGKGYYIKVKGVKVPVRVI